MKALLALVLLLPACDEVGTGFRNPDKDTGVDTDNGGIDTSIGDTEDTDGDLDNDGFTPADGDCDDGDPRVSPAREEDTNDTADNDCDGKVNEEFTGVDVAWVESTGAGHILTVDKVGRAAADVSTGDCVPFFLDHNAENGWYINDSLQFVATVSLSGDCTPLADFTDTATYPFPPFGVAKGEENGIYVTLADRLVHVGDDGAVTELAKWDAEAEFYAIGLAADPLTGTIGVFDAYGGFATYSVADGFEFLVMPDFMNPTLSTVSGAHGDDGNWYAPAYDVTAGSYGVVQFNPTSLAWEMQDAWEDEDWSPFMMAVDASDRDKPEFYITASAGAFQTVWRVVHGTNHADHLYMSDGTDFGNFYGIVNND